MATSDNKGFLYESTINKNLKKYKLQKNNFVPAGADANAPDAMLTYQGKDNKVEVKLDLKVDFGQGSLDYNVEKEEWILGGAKTSSANQMREFLTAIGVVDIVNKEWGPKGPPRKYTVPTNQYKKEDVDHDYKNFKDVFVNIPRTAVANYYNSKKTYYIQIGGFGLYHMGKDIAKLGTDEFKLQLKLRIRIKRGGSIPIYNYRFTTAIQAVNGSLKKTILDLDDITFLSALSARSKK